MTYMGRVCFPMNKTLYITDNNQLISRNNIINYIDFIKLIINNIENVYFTFISTVKWV